ncbi:FG-GAP repeat domain-containing protein [Planctomycetota bacterium]
MTAEAETTRKTAGERKHRLVGTGMLVALTGLLACATLALVVWRASSGGVKPDETIQFLHDDSSPVTLDEDTESRIVAFCSDCHAMPSAKSFPRARWHQEVKRGYEFFARSGRNDLDPPPMHQTIAYFRSRAPDEIVFPAPEEAETKLRAAFAVEKLTLDRDADVLPEIAHLRWTRLGPDDAPVLLLCDMRFGYVAAVDLRHRKPRPAVLARLNHPCHVEPCDLDLIVAEFGHYQTGSIVLFSNVAAAGELPRFQPEVLDPRPGTIHVPVHDFNGDAWDNFYAKTSHGVQWLENLGQLEFAYHRLTDMPGAYRALSGDVDLDGDSDVIAVAWLPPTVMPPSIMAAPLASVLCLEQTEPGIFVRHTLDTGSPYYATLELADFDDDGDLDFAVGPGPHVANALKKSDWLSVWWNQTISGDPRIPEPALERTNQ